MRFNSVLISSFLLVSVGLTDCRRTDRRSRPYGGVERLTNVRKYKTDGNWAGAALEMDNGTFYSVIGTFTIPEKVSGALAAWVGIDGDTCEGGLLQAGVFMNVTQSGPVYEAWYEWYPASAVFFEITNLTFSAGDVIGLAVGAPVNTTYGLVMIENRTKQQAAIANLSSTHALCGQNAEWVIEGLLLDGIPFPNFSPITFTNARAYTHDGRTYGPQDAAIINILDGEVLTSVSVSEDSVTIKHV